MFVRASRWCVLGALVGLAGAMGGCATAHNGTGSIFDEDSGGGQTGGDDSTAPPQSDSGPPISVNEASTQDATMDAACTGDVCAEASAPAVCGDSVVEDGEGCDDGNALAGDGCSSTCQIETGFLVPGRRPTVRPDQPLRQRRPRRRRAVRRRQLRVGRRLLVHVPDRDGWQCPVPGSECTPICGDGMVVGREQCDVGPLPGRDGGAEGGAADAGAPTGCSANCTIDPGFACTPPPGAIRVPRHGLRRRRQRGLRAVRRREPRSLRRVLADVHDRAQVQRHGRVHRRVRRRPRLSGRAMR